MSFEFDLKKREVVKPPIALIYGPAGVGKTSLATQAPNNVYLPTEDGAGELVLNTIKDGVFKTYEEIMAALRWVYANAKGINAIVFDSIDHMEPIVWQYVCENQPEPWDTIESPGYGRGYVEADKPWLKFLDALIKIRDDKNIAVIMIAHDAVRTVNDPMVGQYDAHELKMHKRAVGLFKEKTDLIGLLKNTVVVDTKTKKGKGGTSPTLFVRPNAAYTAKTRYKAMPTMIPISKDTGWADITKYIPYYNAKIEETVAEDEKEVDSEE